MANFTFTVGPSGRTYTTLQAAWNALPATIPVGDNYDITMAAGLYTAGFDVAASAKTVSGSVIIKPEAGAAWYEASGTPNIAVRYDNTKGVAIEASPFLLPVIRLQSNVSIQGIQIKGGADKGAIGFNSNGTGSTISRCIVLADSTNLYCLVTGAFNGTVINNVFITTHTAEPILIDDTNGYIVNFVGNTIIKPGGGGGVWNKGTYGAGLRVKNCTIFGFSGSNATRLDAANSNNNATDLAAFSGTSNVLSLVASNQFTDATAGTLDVRPKSGNGLVAGITNALIPIDALGQTRGATPTIGALEYTTVAGTTIACAVGNAAATGSLASIQGTATVNCAIGSATAAGLPATITNTPSGVTIDCLIGNAAATGMVAAVGTFIMSDQLTNNTGTLLPAQAVVWTWTPAGRIGSMAGITPVDGTGTTDANARLAPGVARAAGRLDIAVRAAAAVDDAVYTEMFA